MIIMSPHPAPIIIDITDPFSLEPEYKNVQEDVNTPAQKQASSPKNIKKDEPGLLGISSSHSPNPGETFVILGGDSLPVEI